MNSPAEAKIIGKFVYQADVVLPRRRKPERVNLVAPCEYAIPSVAKADIADGAVQVRLCTDDRNKKPVRYAGWNGRLWSPLQPAGPDRRRDDAFLLSLDQYRSSFADFPLSATPLPDDEPIALAFDQRIGVPAHLAATPRPSKDATFNAADIRGEILWDNRARSLTAHMRASERLLVVDDTMYLRRMEPVWIVWRHEYDKHKRAEVDLTTIGRFVSDVGEVLSASRTSDYSSAAYDEFRLDRLEDALRWHAQTHGKAPDVIRGEIVELDPAFLARDDAAYAIAGKLRIPLGSLHGMLEHLSPQAVADWKLLTDAVNSALPEDVEIDVDGLRPAIARVKEAMLGCHVRSIDRAARTADELGRLIARLDFEPASKKHLDPADDAAVVSLSGRT